MMKSFNLLKWHSINEFQIHIMFKRLVSAHPLAFPLRALQKEFYRIETFV